MIVHGSRKLFVLPSSNSKIFVEEGKNIPLLRSFRNIAIDNFYIKIACF